MEPLTDNERVEALAVIANDLQPAGKATLASELARLRVVTMSRNLAQDDLEVTVAIYTDELARRGYPIDVVLEVLRGWNSKFWPALIELTEPMDRLTAPRRRLAEALSSESVARAAAKAAEASRRREEVQAYAAERRRRREEEAAAWRRENPGPYPDPAIPLAGPLTRDQPVTAADISRSLKEGERGLATFKMIPEDDPRMADICVKWEVEPTELKPAATEATPKSRRAG